MLPALAFRMRPLRPLALLVLLSSCGGERSLVGTLEEGSEATHVWVVGGGQRTEVVGDSFRLREVPEGVLDLRFAREDDELAAMELDAIPGGEVRLEGIWLEDGLATPTRVSLEGASWILVNGLRLGPPGALPAQVDVAATVLSVADGGDALLARPADAALPDLRVVITPGTRLRSPDGEPVELDGLQRGDSVRVRGPAEGEYVVAAEVVVPRRAGTGDGGG